MSPRECQFSILVWQTHLVFGYNVASAGFSMCKGDALSRDFLNIVLSHLLGFDLPEEHILNHQSQLFQDGKEHFPGQDLLLAQENMLFPFSGCDIESLLMLFLSHDPK